MELYETELGSVWNSMELYGTVWNWMQWHCISRIKAIYFHCYSFALLARGGPPIASFKGLAGEI
jgi:hypothetical protein